MKKAFTMIELVFVIVILGILASLAVPKLVATKDDARVTKAVANLKIHIDRVAAYYTAHNGTFEDIAGNRPDSGDVNFLAMVGLEFKNSGNDFYLDNYATISSDEFLWYQCLTPKAESDGGMITFTKKPYTNIYDQYKSFCSLLFTHPAVKEWMENGIKIGGSAIFKE
ncbi:type II secretion system protein [Campylobacter hyointestinalis]|uniref:type II secretion system protein n=1 Tax=Campylobacter hyointestinalis TaxID=198 RepID=UPI000CE545C6|nr:prepilin-type N-terminal cleavage/methylation domain-containing protein [Campylobacter hyointestinalis]PPB56746.1 hypothetical protein CDQ67_00945 [Campylobacter hyointestinalis subsp. hyointestinalis]